MPPPTVRTADLEEVIDPQRHHLTAWSLAPVTYAVSPVWDRPHGRRLTNNTLAAATTTIVKIAIIVLEKCSLLSLVAMKLNPPSLACAKTFAFGCCIRASDLRRRDVCDTQRQR